MKLIKTNPIWDLKEPHFIFKIQDQTKKKFIWIEMNFNEKINWHEMASQGF